MSDAHDHHGHGDHPPHLAHHWENPKQQFEAGKLGMWLFLATEVLFFGGLFVAYAIWRGNNPDLFRYASDYLDTSLGATNTAVLILSSLTMALAVTYAQTNRQTAMMICLVLTFLGACGFMGIKYVEYTDKFREGIYPGVAFYDPPPDIEKSKYWDPDKPIISQETLFALRRAEAEGIEPEIVVVPDFAEGSSVRLAPAGPRGFSVEPAVRRSVRGDKPEKPPHPLQDPNRPQNLHMFFNIYYMMTGLHGIHVVVGMLVIGWLIVRGAQGAFNSEYFTPVDLVGLYWHLVDLIWIFLFPLFYLI